MAFSFPTAINDMQSVPTSNPRYNSTIGTIHTVTTKPLGNLPVINNAGSWRVSIAGGHPESGVAFEFKASQAGFDVSSDTKLMLWAYQMNSVVRIQAESLANNGISVRLYSGTGSPPANYKRFTLGGNDTPFAECIKGQYPFVIDLNSSTQNEIVGTFDNTNVTTVAIVLKTFVMVGPYDNWSYPSAMYMLDTVKSSANTPTFTGTSEFQDAVDIIQGVSYTTKKGNWIRQIGSVIFMDMPFRIGDGSTATTFNDQGVTVVSPANNDANDPRNRLTDQAMRVYMNLPNSNASSATLSGTYIWGTRAAWDLDQDDSASVAFESPKFEGMGEFSLGSSVEGPATWNDVGKVKMMDGDVDIDGSDFSNPYSNHLLELHA